MEPSTSPSKVPKPQLIGLSTVAMIYIKNIGWEAENSVVIRHVDPEEPGDKRTRQPSSMHIFCRR